MSKLAFTISDANEEMLEPVSSLLKSLDLVYKDLTSHFRNFIVAMKDNQVIGCVGLEIYNRLGLLRSVAVEPKYQGFGVGYILIQNILKKAKNNGIRDIYLLTDTAADFFKKFDFVVISREQVDEEIKQSYEYSEVCPESAIVMIRKM